MSLVDEDLLADAMDDAVLGILGDRPSLVAILRARARFLRQLRLLLDQLPPDWTLNDLREMLS